VGLSSILRRWLRRRPAALLIALAVAGAVLAGAPAPGAAQSAIVVNMDFEFLRQGTAGVVRLSGADIAGGVIDALDRSYPFFPVTDGFAALVSVPLDQRIRRDYPMRLTVYRTDGVAVSMESVLRVESGEFVREDEFTIPSDRMFLLNMDIQYNEDARLMAIYSVVTPQRFWEGQFTYPVNAPLSSPFGSVRAYNDGSVRRHTGYDFSLTSGTPIMASASGRVVYARGLDIHGNHVVIDHGWGVFSAYSHLSQMFVVPGQPVLQGEIIGLSGNTGRSTGPHLHWEIAVNGVWVNPIAFAALRLPT
jgi:murein DD-endopeptidase MepM/ murein hydrolase activator NlpD